MSNKNFDEAEKCFEKLLEKHPNSSMGYWGLSKVYKVSGDEIKHAEALAHFKKVTRYGNPEVFK